MSIIKKFIFRQSLSQVRQITIIELIWLNINSQKYNIECS
ncbi:hypothetical protein CCP3SC5AM1_760012 [Gammaproteobacteria bacterium]